MLFENRFRNRYKGQVAVQQRYPPFEVTPGASDPQARALKPTRDTGPQDQVARLACSTGSLDRTPILTRTAYPEDSTGRLLVHPFGCPTATDDSAKKNPDKNSLKC